MTTTPHRQKARPRRGSSPAERRSKLALRETLDEMLEHVRTLCREHGEMAPHELEYSQDKLEWLADEVWRLIIEERDEI